MFSVSQDDVLRGLKKFRRLAKQDLLASSATSDPTFWSTQAETRRTQYAELMANVEDRGVDAAYQQALDAYAALPLLRGETKDPQTTGREQALEMFFSILGMDAKEITRLKNGRPRASVDDAAVKASL